METEKNKKDGGIDDSIFKEGFDLEEQDNKRDEEEIPLIEIDYEEIKNSVELSTNVKSAESIDDLCRALSAVELIEGSREYEAQEVIDRIRELQDYMRSNISELEISVITGKDNNIKKEMGVMLKNITRGGSLDIRRKAKELLKKEMEEYFHANRKELVETSVVDCHNLDELFFVINQFRKISFHHENGDISYQTPEQIKNLILSAKQELDNKLDNGLARSDASTVRRNVITLIKNYKIPQDSGIDKQVTRILIDYADQKRIDDKSADIANGFWGKIASGVKSLFRR